MRNSGDLWGKVFFLGFGLGVFGIWFCRDFGLRFWAKDFGLGIFGLIFGLRFWAWDFGLRFWANGFHRLVGQGVL